MILERGEGVSIPAHSDFLKKVPQVLGGGAGHFSFTYRDFTAKVPKVLGDEMSEEFRTSLKDAYGRN